MFTVEALTVEHIAGFTHATLDLTDDRVLIGENNSGKTTILRVADWIFNVADRSLLTGERQLTEGEKALLLPARSLKAAKQIILTGHVSSDPGAAEGEEQSKVISQSVKIRIRITRNSLYVGLGRHRNGEEPVSSPEALNLFKLAQDSYDVLWVGADRGGSSTFYAGLLQQTMRKGMEDRFGSSVHGKSKAKQEFKTSLTSLEKLVREATRKLSKDLQDELKGYSEVKARVEIDLTEANLIEFLANSCSLTFSSGDHDRNYVNIDSLGAGTQSQLSVALATLMRPTDRQKILLVDEPEAFLHPTAQQIFSHGLLWEKGKGYHSEDSRHYPLVLISTHSPRVIRESRPRDLVILSDRELFPSIAVGTEQSHRDRFLLMSEAANYFFDKSLLLTEGPGDVAFFEALKSRLIGKVEAAVLARMSVVGVGGTGSFGPWLSLLGRYRGSVSDGLVTAHNILVLADSSDAHPKVIKALAGTFAAIDKKDSKTWQDTASQLAQASSGAARNNALIKHQQVVSTLNLTMEKLSNPLHLSAVDLEYSILMNVSDDSAARLGKEIFDHQAPQDRDGLLQKLGSRGSVLGRKTQGAFKSPRTRQLLAEKLESEEFSDDIILLLRRWIIGGGAEYSVPALRQML